MANTCGAGTCSRRLSRNSVVVKLSGPKRSLRAAQVASKVMAETRELSGASHPSIQAHAPRPLVVARRNHDIVGKVPVGCRPFHGGALAKFMARERAGL